MIGVVLDRTENAMGKEENTDYQDFLFFQQYFQKLSCKPLYYFQKGYHSIAPEIFSEHSEYNLVHLFVLQGQYS